MKFLKFFFIGLLSVILLLVIGLFITDNDHIFKAVSTVYGTGHKTSFISDYSYFDNNTIKAGDHQPWATHKNYNTATPTDTLEYWNKRIGTVAYLVIKNDSIWFEKYYDNYSKDSKSNSFSMAKSVTSALLGKAIMDGYIKSLDQPVSDFIPEFKEGLAAKVTVGDLSSMASGSNWDENYYSPFSITPKAYYGDDIEDVMLNRKIVKEPGKAFEYSSGDTQFLAMVLRRATGKSLAEYLSESLWKPMGAEHDAPWLVDSKKNGVEKAYCCIASNARDFARFGKLYKDFGKWNGKQLLDSTFVAKSITPRFKNHPEYGYGWWLKKRNGKQFFMMRGHLGQYVIVQPEDNLIIVRLGHQKTPDEYEDKIFTNDIDIYIDEAYKMLAKHDTEA